MMKIIEDRINRKKKNNLIRNMKRKNKKVPQNATRIVSNSSSKGYDNIEDNSYINFSNLGKNNLILSGGQKK